MQFVLALVFYSSFALANNSFITLNPSLPNSENSVIEAFSYKCIHCYNHHKFGTLEKLREAFPNLHFKLYPVSLMNGEFSKEMNEFLPLLNTKMSKMVKMRVILIVYLINLLMFILFLIFK